MTATKDENALLVGRIWREGIGPDAEVFTKSQPMRAIGHGASVGLHPISTWNNPEPEVMLVITSAGRTIGAALGNDVNLRDVEGRSALLLGKAKYNNASCAIRPFLRVFNDSFGAGFLATLATGGGIGLAVDRAAKLAGAVIQRRGALAPDILENGGTP